ncbi:MAG: ABC transporter permease [Cryomorphaceae bacterium]|nr:ABC transporter permease [Cryomorphaceae bacterium]
MLLIKLAWRNLWRSRRRTWITISSVIFAVILALFLQSMDYGSQELMVQNTVRFTTGYAQIQDTLYQDEPNLDNAMVADDAFMAEIVEKFTDIEYVVPRLESVMLVAGEIKSRVGFVSGISPKNEHRFNGIKDRLEAGEFFNQEEGGAVIGTELAKNLDLSLGDSLVLFGQGFQGSMAAGKYVIVGLVRHPVPDFNSRIVFLQLHEAQWLFDAYDRLTHLKLVPKKMRHAHRLVSAVNAEESLSGYRAYTWEELQPELVQTIAFDRAGTLIFLLILYIVIGFGIFGTILTMTLEREKEFGMLISIGMLRGRLATVVFLETLIINFLGVLLGVLVAFPILIYFYYNPISLGAGLEEMMAEYGMEAILPFSLNPQIFVQQALIVFGISMVIVLYPLVRIARLDVLQASRK